MDVNPDKLDTMAALARRMVAQQGVGAEPHAAVDRQLGEHVEEAVDVVQAAAQVGDRGLARRDQGLEGKME